MAPAKETRLRCRTGTLGCVKYGASVRQTRLAAGWTQTDHVAQYLAHRRGRKWTPISARALLSRHNHRGKATYTGLGLPRHRHSCPGLRLRPRSYDDLRSHISQKLRVGSMKAFRGQRVPCGRERTANPYSYSSPRRRSNGPGHGRGGATLRVGRAAFRSPGRAGPLPTESRRRQAPPLLAPTYCRSPEPGAGSAPPGPQGPRVGVCACGRPAPVTQLPRSHRGSLSHPRPRPLTRLSPEGAGGLQVAERRPPEGAGQRGSSAEGGARGAARLGAGLGGSRRAGR